MKHNSCTRPPRQLCTRNDSLRPGACAVTNAKVIKTPPLSGNLYVNSSLRHTRLCRRFAAPCCESTAKTLIFGVICMETSELCLFTCHHARCRCSRYYKTHHVTDLTASTSTISIAILFTILQNTWHDIRNSVDVNYNNYCYIRSLTRHQIKQTQV